LCVVCEEEALQVFAHTFNAVNVCRTSVSVSAADERDEHVSLSYFSVK
jgi:hypothetical protein